MISLFSQLWYLAKILTCFVWWHVFSTNGAILPCDLQYCVDVDVFRQVLQSCMLN